MRFVLLDNVSQLQYSTKQMGKHETEVNRRWRESNPLAHSAHMILAAAIRAHKIDPQPCEICGAKAHGHHDDYTKPLDVRWLCNKHHREHHTKLNGDVIGGKYHPKAPQWPYRSKYQPAPKRDASIEQARALRADGRTYQEIATTLGTTKGQIYKWLNPKPYA